MSSRKNLIDTVTVSDLDIDLVFDWLSERQTEEDLHLVIAKINTLFCSPWRVVRPENLEEAASLLGAYEHAARNYLAAHPKEALPEHFQIVVAIAPDA